MIIQLIISIYICIILHELAHLLSAKIVKCKVEVFSIGFGKEIFHFNYRGTKYRLALLPFGGFNKLEHELDYCRCKTALPNLSYSKKLFVLLSGCFVNIIVGVIAYYLGLKLLNENLFYFGLISFALGISNLLPIPALDGSYPFLFLIERVIPKKYSLQFIRWIVKWGFRVLSLLNILCIPWLIWNWRKIC